MLKRLFLRNKECKNNNTKLEIKEHILYVTERGYDYKMSNTTLLTTSINENYIVFDFWPHLFGHYTKIIVDLDSFHSFESQQMQQLVTIIVDRTEGVFLPIYVHISMGSYLHNLMILSQILPLDIIKVIIEKIPSVQIMKQMSQNMSVKNLIFTVL